MNVGSVVISEPRQRDIIKVAIVVSAERRGVTRGLLSALLSMSFIVRGDADVVS